ncbi:MAG: SDR family NAD(P)-dependent oxidoreductase [Actinomycetes bacterium]
MGTTRNVVVTGAAGFIGRGTCERLAAEGARVTGLDLDPASASAVEAVGASFSVCDTTDAEAVDSALEGADAVIHAAAIVSDHGPMRDFIEVNVRGTRNVLDSARRHGAKSVVHVSSVASWGYEFNRPPTDSAWTRRQGVPYVDTKAASDDLALRRGAAVVRPGDVYGPRSVPWSIRPLEAMKAGTFRLPGRGEGVMTPVFGDDLVDLVIRALDTPAAAGRAFTGFDGTPVTAAEFFGHYARMLGMDAVPTSPRPLALAATWAIEMGAKLTGRPPSLTRTAITFIERSAPYDTSLAGDLLGWSQTVGLTEGMTRTEEWFRETGLLP